jgi:formylglycine-generating enzyme required for sulfatase activity
MLGVGLDGRPLPLFATTQNPGPALPRLFISHSSKDNVEALAFRRWLVANGWAESDVFIDLHGIGAGERWRETLRKANAACEAVVLLASPNSLASIECEKELELAEALSKPIIPAIIRDLTVKHPRLAPWADRQIVDLSQQPAEPIEPFEHEGKLHRVEFSVAALASIKARLADLGIAAGSFAWEPRKRHDGKNAGPYPGLAAFEEGDAGIFFGREADIVAGLTKLRLMRKRRSPRLFVIQAASGAGKSSFLKAGLWPRLKRDPDFAPLCILRPAQGILTGPDGIGQRIAPWFERHRHMKVPGDIEASLTQPDRAAVSALAGLLDEATALATTARRAGVVDARPPAPLLAVDQGEELFASENAAESERFLALLASVFNDLPEDVDPYVLVTIRADSVEPLLERWPALRLAAPETQMLPPLSPTAYRDVITKPAEVYTERVRRLVVEPALAAKLALDATGADALPLLAFTLEKLFEKFGADGNLTLERYEGIKGIGGSIDIALGAAMRQAGALGTDDHLRRLIVPGLATWDLAANAPKRLVAIEAKLLAGKRSELAPLANALVANRLLTRGSGTLEVAHEALLRRPPIDGWLAERKDALKLRDDVLREAKDWADVGKNNDGLVRRGARLKSALDLLAKEDFAAILAPASEYLGASRRRESWRHRLLQVAYVILVLIAWSQSKWIDQGLSFIDQGLSFFTRKIGWSFSFQEPWFQEPVTWWLSNSRSFAVEKFMPYIRTARQERDMEAAAAACVMDRAPERCTFRECAAEQGNDYCPEMVVLPGGAFMMGSPSTENGRSDNEGPQHAVKIAKPFAVSKFALTFKEWVICEGLGYCVSRVRDTMGGSGERPLINVTWKEARSYVQWLSRMTGKDYRLLTEAEYEYATRAGTQTAYPWGDDIGTKNANCRGCSSQWDGKQVAPVGSFGPNGFGLYDMVGNVWEWVEDCYHYRYDDAPQDGSAWRTGDCSNRVVRGGSWDSNPQSLRSANRDGNTPGDRSNNLGFRVGRTLTP